MSHSTRRSRQWRAKPAPVYASLALLLGVVLLLEACSIGGTVNLPASPTATPTADASATAVPGGTPLPGLQAKLETKTLTGIFPGAATGVVEVFCPPTFIAASGGISSSGTD